MNAAQYFSPGSSWVLLREEGRRSRCKRSAHGCCSRTTCCKTRSQQLQPIKSVTANASVVLSDDLEHRYDYESQGGQHLYLRMVEPIFFIFSSKEWKPVMRYFAQECLAIMCLGCRYIN